MSLYGIDSAVLRGLVGAVWLAALLALVLRRRLWISAPGAVRLLLAALAVTGLGVIAELGFMALRRGEPSTDVVAGGALALIAGAIALAAVLRYPTREVTEAGEDLPTLGERGGPGPPGESGAHEPAPIHAGVEDAGVGIMLLALGADAGAASTAGQILYANRTARAWLGLDAEASALPSLAALLTSRGQAAQWPVLAEHLAVGRAGTVVLPLAGAAQGPSLVRLVLAPGGRDAEGRELAVAVLEDETAEGLPQEAVQAEKLSALSKLAAGIAHDFSNVLTIILTACEILLLDETLPEKTRQRIERMQRAAQRGGDLSDQLRAFAGHQELAEEQMDLNDLFRSSAVMFKEALGNGIDLHFDLVDRPAPVLVDPLQFRDALLSVMKHCRQELPEGGRVDVHTRLRALNDRAGAAPSAAVTLTIVNSGRVLSPEEATGLLEPYGLASSTGSGGGFGLSLVASFVRQSRGRVRVTSEAGRGTILEIELPLAESEGGEGALSSAGNAGSVPPGLGGDMRGAASVQSRPLRVLVVDDDEMVRDAVGAELANLGCVTEGVGSAADCLARLEAGGGFDVVLADHSLKGGENGARLALQVRERHPGVRVVLMSGDLGRIERDGLDGVFYLPKPFTRMQLRESLGLGGL